MSAKHRLNACVEQATALFWAEPPEGAVKLDDPASDPWWSAINVVYYLLEKVLRPDERADLIIEMRSNIFEHGTNELDELLPGLNDMIIKLGQDAFLGRPVQVRTVMHRFRQSLIEADPTDPFAFNDALHELLVGQLKAQPGVEAEDNRREAAEAASA